jgi:cytochrome c oxidase subunit 4
VNLVADTHKKGEHHEHGLGRYIVVWLVLLVFTAITVITGRIDLGAANIYLAMAIACTKAALVVIFFMHLSDSGGVNRLVFVASVLFAIVMMVGVFGDLMTRLSFTLPNGGPMPAGEYRDVPRPGEGGEGHGQGH